MLETLVVRTDFGTSEKLGGGQLTQPKQTFASGRGSAEHDPQQTLVVAQEGLYVHCQKGIGCPSQAKNCPVCATVRASVTASRRLAEYAGENTLLLLMPA